MRPSESGIDRIDRFVDSMAAALREAAEQSTTPAVERRKLRTIVAACGRRGTARLLADLQERLNRAGVYTEPALTDSGLRLDDWVLFATGPFPPDATFFPKERDLQRFVEACLGSSVFRKLVPYRANGKTSGREFRLSDGRRIDLLCEERMKVGKGAIVAIELKREHDSTDDRIP